MRVIDKAAVVDEELHDLKLRFELLEGDRKAYYETSQWAIKRNKEEVNQLRLQNKQVSEAIARIKKSETEAGSIRGAMSELEKFDHKICETQKKYDELQAEARTKEDRLRGLVDQLADLKREAEAVKSNMKDSPQAKEIRMLENRLDKAMIKYNEAQSIRKTYEQIVKRLQDERLTFDNQLANFEKSLKAKKQDASELEMMSRDANHAKEVAKAELARFEQQINEERKQREKDLAARKELVKQKLEINDKMDRKITKLDDPNADLNGGNDKNEQYDEAVEKKIADYEETMRLIKEATGVSDIHEVIVKFQSQGETHNHLDQLQKANEKRIEDLKAKKAQVLKEFEELKYSGESKQAHRRQIIDEFQKHLEESQAKTAESKQRFDRAAKLLANAKAGVQHLVDKLESVRLPDQPNSSTKGTVVNTENIANVLQLCVKKLEHLAQNVNGKELPDTSSSLPTGESANILYVNQSVLPAYNTRVKLKPVEFEPAEIEEDDEDEDGYGEVLDRETIKKHTAQMLNARLKTKQTKKVKKKKATKDEDSN